MNMSQSGGYIDGVLIIIISRRYKKLQRGKSQGLGGQEDAEDPRQWSSRSRD